MRLAILINLILIQKTVYSHILLVRDTISVCFEKRKKKYITIPSLFTSNCEMGFKHAVFRFQNIVFHASYEQQDSMLE